MNGGNNVPCKLKVILTGASGLIGCAIANEFQQSEIKIVLAGKNKKKLQDTYLNREKFGGYYFWSGDLSDDKACRELVAYAVQHMGGVDILINCAGVFNFSLPKIPHIARCLTHLTLTSWLPFICLIWYYLTLEPALVQ